MIIPNALIEGCQKKDRSAQKRLYTLLLPYLNAVCGRYLNYTEERQDTLQEAFIKIFTNINQFDPSRSQFKTWAVKITINCCLKCNVKAAKNDTQEFLPEQNSQTVTPKVLEKLSDEDLQNFLKTMPQKYYEVFNLHIIDGFSHKEIAALLNIEEALSRKRLSRARAWLSSKSTQVEMMVFGVNEIGNLN